MRGWKCHLAPLAIRSCCYIPFEELSCPSYLCDSRSSSLLQTASRKHVLSSGTEHDCLEKFSDNIIQVGVVSVCVLVLFSFDANEGKKQDLFTIIRSNIRIDIGRKFFPCFCVFFISPTILPFGGWDFAFYKCNTLLMLV